MHCQLSPNYTKVLVATSLMHYCFNGAGSAEEPFSQTHVVLFAGADDWEEAYQSLRQIVMEDLLLEEEEEEGQRSSKVGTSTGILLCNNTNWTVGFHPFYHLLIYLKGFQMFFIYDYAVLS